MASRFDRGGSHRPVDPARSQGLNQDPNAPRPQAGPAGGRIRSASRVSDFEAWDGPDALNHLQADSSSSDEDLHPSGRPSRPSHTRSMSHPFPSLFSIRKKKSGSMAAADRSDPDSDDGGQAPLPGARSKTMPLTRGNRNASSAGSRDFATGHCMTCGSMVRWPRELHVFKCTICLTINDLRPADWASRREDGQETADPSDRPISLRYTKSLVQQCLRSFLLSALKRRLTNGSADAREPVAAPSRSPPSQDRLAVPSFDTPPTTRPANSVTSQPWPVPGGPGAPGQRRRAPSWAGSTSSTYSASLPERPTALRDFVAPDRPVGHHKRQPPSSLDAEARRIFRPLEDYIIRCFTSFHCLNSSFLSHRGNPYSRQNTDDGRRRPPEQPAECRKDPHTTDHSIPDLDPKLLLLGDVAENGIWWTGNHDEVALGRSTKNQNGRSVVSSRSPHLEWAELEEWYSTVVEAARSWPDVYESLVDEEPALAVSDTVLQEIEARILAGQEHAQRTLLKACETILKRPGRRITEPQELRFLLIISANPLLHASCKPFAGKFAHPEGAVPAQAGGVRTRGTAPSSGRHSGIIKRIVGLMSNAPVECRNHLVTWFARYPESWFVQTKELFSGFLAYRLVRQNEKKYEAMVDITGGLVPSVGAGQSPASLHAALGQASGSRKKRKEKTKIVYREDWQIKAAAQVLGFLFTANNMGHARRSLTGRADSPGTGARERARRQGQILATSDFYTTLLDDADLVADFEAWERKQGRFSFCQYPYLLSIGAKIQILEHDARRQMENKARDAFFDSILTNRAVQQFLVLNIRRECLVDDSLKAVSEVIGGGGEDIKKGLRIVFKGEEGVDAGGLRKEWFLLLVREVFNPDHGTSRLSFPDVAGRFGCTDRHKHTQGMFLYDEDSRYCYFNPNSLEPSEQFFLVGVVLGLAIYNSTILDVALPPFAFRKLLLAAPPSAVATSQPRQTMTYTLDDLAEYRPRLARGLRQLLEFEGDVESAFSLDFAIDTDRYGATERVPLCPGGERRPVTNANRREYVDAYVRYLLDTAVARQFEPFKRGFFTVCAGSALSLFRPEEIEVLVRGSGSRDEPIDVAALRAVAQYDGWGVDDPAEREPTVRWFWEAFAAAPPADQRRLLAFVTGSDRLPALGAASLAMRIACLGDDCGRFPTARTCFNLLALWRCASRERLEGMLWRAVDESEGFGLK